MARAETSDGVGLHYESTGSGEPILFLHEFAGDHRSWAPQVAHFAPEFRCLVYAARGYPPSDVPADPAAYSQERAVEDAVEVLDAAGVDKALAVGLSMGGFAALHLVLKYPQRVKAAVVAGVGYGAQPERREQFRTESLAVADAFERHGAAKVAESYAVGPARVQLQNKNPQAWRGFAAALAAHDSLGATLTMRGVQASRPSLYDLQAELAAVRTPILVVAGDEDDGSLEPSIMLKRVMPTAGLAVLPRTGHTLNLEEPELFNSTVERFVAAVEAGAWPPRDPRSVSGSITGVSVPRP